MDEPDYILDIGGLKEVPAEGSQEDGSARKSGIAGKKCIYVLFECCGVYCHIYKNKNATAYEGRCPKCLRPISVKIGEGGTNQRFFRAK